MELSVAANRDSLGLKHWSVAQLSELFSFSGGLTASRDQLSPSVGIPYLHYGDIHGSKRNYINVRDEYLDIPKLDVNLKHVSASSFLKTGDVVFVDASEDDDGTSRHIVVINTDNLPFISGLHTVTAKSTSSKLSNNFRRYCFQSESIKRQFKFFAVGTKVSGVSKGNIGKIRVCFPDSLVEQEAIAEALSDADAYIGSLEQLLAKKRDIKQGVMQDLLTGTLRLSGYVEQATVRQIGEVAVIDADNLNSSSTSGDFAFSYISLDDVQVGFLRSHSDQIFKTAPSRARRRLERNDILCSTVRPLLQSHLLFDEQNGNWICSTGFSVIRCDPRKADAGYIFWQLFSDSLTKQITTLLVGSNYPAINSRDVSRLQIRFVSVREQRAISNVISDLYSEIRELELKRDKVTAVKQAMMQELLTGRTRLV